MTDTEPSRSPAPGTPPTGWLRYTVRVPAAKAEACAAFLGTVSGAGVEIAAESAGETTIITYVGLDQSLEDKKARITGFLATLEPAVHWSVESIADSDWNRLWKEHFKPQRLTDRLVVKPSWTDYRPQPEDLVIELDPGMAFGTGHHATTRLVLQLLEEYVCAGHPCGTVLDIGTGTGILAMAAALLGCSRVTAVDNDQEAVRVATDNVRANRLSDRITVSDTPLDQLPADYDIVMANIIHDTLVELADNICGRLALGGILILSGILRGDQTASIRSHYAGRRLACIRIIEADEWAAVVLQRKKA